MNKTRTLLLLLIFGVTFSAFVPTSFEASFVNITSGSSAPGCENTNSCFQPYIITVDVGGVVTWINNDTAAHTVTSGNPSSGSSGMFDSGIFTAGKTFEYKFDSPGKIEYYCQVHPWMIGIVTVSSVAPPGDKIQISNTRTTDEFGNLLTSGTVNKNISIASDITNLQNVQQSFAYFVQVKDSSDVTVALAWIDGTLQPSATSHPALSWTPSKAGDYTAQVFVYESIQKPEALAKPVSISVTVNGGVPQTVPSPPTNLIAKQVSQTQVNLSWQPPANNGGSAITEYRIDVKVGSGNYLTLTTVGNTNTYSHTSLSPDTTYTYRVSAINSVGTSKPSSEVVEVTSPGETSDAEKYTILFKTGKFFPVEGLDIKGIVGNRSDKEQVHFLLQFIEFPTKNQQDEISKKGLHLLDYITGNVFIVSAKVEDVKNYLPNLVPKARWAGPFTGAEKISPDITSGKIGDWALTQNKNVVLTIEFNRDIKIETALDRVKYFGGNVFSTVSIGPSVTASFDFNMTKISEIAQDDLVRYVDLVSLPLRETNDGAREAARVDRAASNFSLTGDGVRVLVYDSNVVDAHADFDSRISERDSHPHPVNSRDHATHVAGTLGGDGSNNNRYAGMAPGVTILSYSTYNEDFFDTIGDLTTDITTTITRVDLATLSLANNVFEQPDEPCWKLGDYSDAAEVIDQIVRGEVGNQPLIFFESVGNERKGNVCGSGIDKFFTVSSPATAKNSIAVGAINSSDNSIWHGSSFGPTDDGRVKPDITAPGCEDGGDGGITSTFSTNSYRTTCGTSMATPVAAGSAALLIEKWKLEHGGVIPLPHTVKAILIHTATDLGNIGPDYRYGWGVLDALSAIELLEQNNSKSLIIVDEISQGELPDEFEFMPSNSGNVKVTLVWDDLPGSRLSTNDLRNDLDLEVIDPTNHTYLPFILNSSEPDAAATRNKDTTNNVEMVVADKKDGNWKIKVKASRVEGSQNYTLIMSVDPTFVVPEFPVAPLVLIMSLVLMMILSSRKLNKRSLP